MQPKHLLTVEELIQTVAAVYMVCFSYYCLITATVDQLLCENDQMRLH
jgi:uncharacterized protein (UPF0262 family)